MIVYTAPDKLAPWWAAKAAESRNVIVVAENSVSLRRIFDTTARVLGTGTIKRVSRSHTDWCIETEAGWTLRFGIHIPRGIPEGVLVLRALQE